MNIAIATDNFKPSGGMERYVFDLVQGFLAKQITPSVFSMKISPEFAKLCPTHKISQFPISQLRYAVFNAILQKNRRIGQINTDPTPAYGHPSPTRAGIG